MQEVKPIVETKPVGSYTSDPQTKSGADDPAILDINGPTGSDANSSNDIKIVDESVDKTPLEVLKSPDFYILWLALAFNHYGYIIKNNYYKVNVMPSLLALRCC